MPLLRSQKVELANPFAELREEVAQRRTALAALNDRTPDKAALQQELVRLQGRAAAEDVTVAELQTLQERTSEVNRQLTELAEVAPFQQRQRQLLREELESAEGRLQGAAVEAFESATRTRYAKIEGLLRDALGEIDAIAATQTGIQQQAGVMVSDHRGALGRELLMALSTAGAGRDGRSRLSPQILDDQRKAS